MLRLQGAADEQRAKEAAVVKERGQRQVANATCNGGNVLSMGLQQS